MHNLCRLQQISRLCPVLVARLAAKAGIPGAAPQQAGVKLEIT